MSTTYLSHELHGESVVSLVDGRIIAKVADVLIDPEAHQAAALVTSKGNLLKRQIEAIPAEKVQVWGQDVVLVDDSDVVREMDGLPSNEGWLSVSEQIRGHDVVSSKGTRIGTLGDVVLDLKGQLIAYELDQVFVEGPLAESKRIPVETVHSLGHDVLIVDGIAAD
jgi:sporulation protein YlmC with PRC-barrel domain